MKIFRRSERTLSPRAAELADRWTGRLLYRQRQAADWLGRKTQYWNKTSKIIALALFCLVFGSLSAWLILKHL